MFKQICFFKKRPDMSMEQFMDYYENHHSKLGQKIGRSSIPNAVRYVRRYLTPANPICIAEEHDSPMGPNGEIYDWVPVARGDMAKEAQSL